jgi:signal transduction histidine kinase
VWRRTHPVAMVALLVVLIVPSATLIDPSEMVSTFFPVLILSYSVGAYAEPRAARIGLALLVGGAAAIPLLDDTGEAAPEIFPIALVLLCWLAGVTVRTRSRHAAELHEAAASAAERREQEAQLAVAGERRRIAREMHDVVAHSISLMVVQAGGARRIIEADPVRAEEAAARIRAAGVEALAEMETLLGVLDAPAAGVPSMEGLVERARAAGLPVELTVEGTPGKLPAGVDLAAYRVIQEALTNTLKHAGPAPTRVLVRYGRRDLELEVANEGERTMNGSTDDGGHGLAGMEERVHLVGGEMLARPRPEGGFLVQARLPVTVHGA